MTACEPVTGADPVGEQSLGAALRSAREAAGLTVDQVSATTRIRATLVRDLEADQLASSGGAVYARGHVRALARAVGVDPSPLVALLDRAVGEAPAEVATPVALAPSRRTTLGPLPLSTAPDRRGPHWGAAGAVAAVVLVALFAVGSWLGDRPEPRDGLQLLTAPADSAPPPVAPPPAEPAPPPAPAGAELALRISGGASWISVSSPTQVLFEGEVADGWAETFRDPSELRLRVGNAAAVHVTCAGADTGPAGATGQVRTVVCGAGGLLAA